MNGSAGIVSWLAGGRQFSVMGCTVKRGKPFHDAGGDDPRNCRLHEPRASAEITKATDWQAHSVRGFIATASKKHGVTIESVKDDAGERAYRSFK